MLHLANMATLWRLTSTTDHALLKGVFRTNFQALSGEGQWASANESWSKREHLVELNYVQGLCEEEEFAVLIKI